MVFAIKLTVLVVIALIAIVLGGMAAAWRRACVNITLTIATARWMHEGMTSDPPSVRQLSQNKIIRYTPEWVSARDVTAIFFLLLTGILGFLMFSWYVALGAVLLTYILIESAGFLFSRRDDPYYVAQVYERLWGRI